MVNPTKIQYNLIKIFYGDTLIYEAYNAYFATILEEDPETAYYAKKLLEAHTAYYVYYVEKNETKADAKDAFIAAYEFLQTLDKNEVDEDFFNTYLKEIYDFVIETFETLDDSAEN